LPRRQATSLPQHVRCRAFINRPGRLCGILEHSRFLQRLFKIPDNIRSDPSAAIFDPFGNATHTALAFNLVGEDVLITGAGTRSASWRSPHRRAMWVAPLRRS